MPPARTTASAVAEPMAPAAPVTSTILSRRRPISLSPLAAEATLASRRGLAERHWLRRVGRDVEHVEGHRDERVIAEDSDVLDGRRVAENFHHLRVSPVAYPLAAVELGDEIEDRPLVGGSRFGRPAGA